MDQAQTRTYDVATAIAALRAKLVWILLAGVALGAVGLLYALSLERTYKAEASIYPHVPDFADSAFENEVLVNTAADPLTAYAELADLDQIARETSQALDGALDPIAIDDDVTVTSTGGLISIEAEAADADLAAELANTYARVAIDSRRRAAVNVVDRVTKNLQANLDQVPKGSSQGRGLQRRIDDLDAYRDFQTGNTEKVQTAVVPADSEGRPILTSAVGGGIAGMLIAIAAVLLGDRIRPRIRDRRTAEEAFDAPVMATFTGDGAGAAVEALRAKLLQRPGERPPQTVVLVPLRTEGADRIARRLVDAVARSGRRAITIDADLGSTGSPSGAGLAEVLEGRASRASVVTEVLEGRASRASVTTGQPDGADSIGPGESARGHEDTAAFLHRPGMEELLDELADEYELIVINAPSPIAAADAAPLISQAADTLAVVSLNALESDCRALADEIRSVGGTLRGVVLVER